MNFVKNNKINVCIQGLGYVGSAMGVALGNARNKKNLPLFNIIGVEPPTARGFSIINKINSGVFPFACEDQFLLKKFNEVHKKKIFTATTSHSAYTNADILLVSVNCDIKKKGNYLKVDLVSFKKCIEEFSKKIKENTLIIIESTIPPGTCEKIIVPIIKKNFEKRNLNKDNFYLAHSYERVMPGKNYLNSIINNWRVFSGLNKKSSYICELFLKKFINTKKYPLTKLDSLRSSELSKLMENSYRAVNIAFIEEWSRFAEEINVDIFKVIEAIKKRPTHQNIKSPGFGVGGYCLTKDPLMADLSVNAIWKKNNKFSLSKQSVKINNVMPLVSVKKIVKFFKNKVRGKKILLLGASYKEEVDDTRSSPSQIFYSRLISLGAKIDVHDPLVKFWKELSIEPHKKIPLFTKYDCVVFAVKHKVYSKISFKKWNAKRKNFLFFDANNVLSERQIKNINKFNFNFISIGRGQ